ncbi:MAG: DUF3299 domain-containing protein [Hyphomicrobiales bacterium]
MTMIITRRQALQLLSGVLGVVAATPSLVLAASTPKTIEWADLSPTGEAVLLPPVVHSGPGTGQPQGEFMVVPELDAMLVRIPGFIIPLEFDELDVVEFILAPYKGACIHVPAPPPNQLVHVITDDPFPSAKLIRPVWVTGVLHTITSQTGLAATGYSMRASRIELYQRS